MKIIKFKKDTAVVIQGQKNPGIFYIVKTGYLEVSSDQKLNNKKLSSYSKGESFGLVSAFSGNTFLASIFASVDSELIQIPLSEFAAFLQKNRKFGIKMLSLYTSELREIHRYLSRVNPPVYRPNSPERLLFYSDRYIKLGQPKYASYALNKFSEWIASTDEPEKEAMLLGVKNKLAEIGEDYHGYQWTSSQEKLPASEVIFLEGEAGEDIYVIKSGSVKLFYLGREHEIVIDVLGPGEIFGEMALIDQRTRMASAITEEETELIRVKKDALFDTVGDKILIKIFSSITRRIWFSYQKLFALRTMDPIARIYNFLYQLAKNNEMKSSVYNPVDISFNFDINLEELKKICGLVKIEDERLEPFLSDPNIQITGKQICVANWKKIEDKIAFYKNRVG